MRHDYFGSAPDKYVGLPADNLTTTLFRCTARSLATLRPLAVAMLVAALSGCADESTVLPPSSLGPASPGFV